MIDSDTFQVGNLGLLFLQQVSKLEMSEFPGIPGNCGLIKQNGDLNEDIWGFLETEDLTGSHSGSTTEYTVAIDLFLLRKYIMTT